MDPLLIPDLVALFWAVAEPIQGISGSLIMQQKGPIFHGCASTCPRKEHCSFASALFGNICLVKPLGLYFL